jgi:hypothetical protein
MGDLARAEIIQMTSQETVIANAELQVTRVHAGESSTVLYGNGGVIIGTKSDAQSQTTLNRSESSVDKVTDESSSTICALCFLPVTQSDGVEAMDQWWHAEHSECRVCQALIGTTSFVEIQGFVYCEKHYQRLQLGPELGPQNEDSFKIVDE